MVLNADSNIHRFLLELVKASELLCPMFSKILHASVDSSVVWYY